MTEVKDEQEEQLFGVFIYFKYSYVLYLGDTVNRMAVFRTAKAANDYLVASMREIGDLYIKRNWKKCPDEEKKWREKFDAICNKKDDDELFMFVCKMLGSEVNEFYVGSHKLTIS